MRVMERTRVHRRNDYVQCSKCNNSVSIQARVMVHVFCNRLMVLYIGMLFRENISNGIRVTERTLNYEALTDGRTLKFRTV